MSKSTDTKKHRQLKLQTPAYDDTLLMEGSISTMIGGSIT